MELKSPAVNPGFSLVPGKGFVTLKLTKASETVSPALMVSALKAVEEIPAHVLVDCEAVSQLAPDWCRNFLLIQKRQTELGKKLRFYNTSTALKNSVKALGLDSALKLSGSLKDALTELELTPKRTIDTEFINPFLTATLKVLEIQAQVKAQAGQVHLKDPGNSLKGDVSGVIGIVSDSFNGTVVISFPEQTFLKVMSGMLGEEFTELSQDIVDGTGEIINMIFGQAKIVLNEKGYGIKTALPSVVSGKDHVLSTQTTGTVVVVPFESNCGNFFIEICVSN